jgi:hypothetical protein
MSGVISLQMGGRRRTWFAPGWCFNGILDRVLELNSTEAEVVGAIEQAKYLNGLHFDQIGTEELSRRLFDAIRSAATEGSRGEFKVRVGGRTLPEPDQAAFRDSMKALLGSLM